MSLALPELSKETISKIEQYKTGDMGTVWTESILDLRLIKGSNFCTNTMDRSLVRICHLL